ncbi:MAG: SDR family NAD(P)-dependent oxidoreductase, partial [Sphingomonadales bacterium]
MAVADVSERTVAELVSLDGRCAIVTGGAQGLGKAMARRLVEAGASVLIGDLNLAAAEAAAGELAARYGDRIIAAEMDVTDSASVAAVADRDRSTVG